MRKIGKTVIFDKPPKIIGHAGVAGKKEGEGPLAKDFDMIFEDTTMGQQSYELAESAMLHDAIIRSLSNAGVAPSSVDFVLSGDLLNQCMGSAFALKDLEIPSIGLFGACSTMALSRSTFVQRQAISAQAKGSFVFRLNTGVNVRRRRNGLLREPAAALCQTRAGVLKSRQFKSELLPTSA